LQLKCSHRGTVPYTQVDRKHTCTYKVYKLQSGNFVYACMMYTVVYWV